MKTFLEILQNKNLPLQALGQQINVWRLNDTTVGMAILEASTPSIADIEKLCAAREQCERLVVCLPTEAQEQALLWAHSEAIDALSFCTKEELSKARDFNANLILGD